jgi:hypothetical protein
MRILREPIFVTQLTNQTDWNLQWKIDTVFILTTAERNDQVTLTETVALNNSKGSKTLSLKLKQFSLSTF